MSGWLRRFLGHPFMVRRVSGYRGILIFSDYRMIDRFPGVWPGFSAITEPANDHCPVTWLYGMNFRG